MPEWLKVAVSLNFLEMVISLSVEIGTARVSEGHFTNGALVQIIINSEYNCYTLVNLKFLFFTVKFVLL